MSDTGALGGKCATGNELDSLYRCGIVLDRAGDDAIDGSDPRIMEVEISP